MANSTPQLDSTIAPTVLDRPRRRWGGGGCSRRAAASSLRWEERFASFYEQARSEAPRRHNYYYYQRIQKRLAGVIEPNKRVLDIGCGDGRLLASLRPAEGIGVDLNRGTIEAARQRHPKMRFLQMRGEDVHRLDAQFDYVIISQVLGEIYDLRRLFQSVQGVCHAETRLIVVHWSRLWQPALKVAEWLRIKKPSPEQNWVPADEVRHLLGLSGFDTVRSFTMTIAPLRVPLVSEFLNRFVANLPVVNNLGLNYVIVARPVTPAAISAARPHSLSIVVPARNEAGHIKPLLETIPSMAPRQEVVFVEGGSTDDTWQAIQDAALAYKGPFDIKLLQQDGTGKGDAVRDGFAAATGDVLMILDADISVPPEELPQFYEAIAEGRGEFINGSRMVYLMDRKAMRFLNLLGNKLFGWLFSYMLSQRFRDTLCGTKVLTRENYRRIAANRSFLGDFDPFGDFDLLFGASKLNLKIIDMPVHYKERTYGATNISRVRHGLMLLRMSLIAAWKLKWV